jgi:hypothetical protein
MFSITPAGLEIFESDVKPWLTSGCVLSAVTNVVATGMCASSLGGIWL